MTPTSRSSEVRKVVIGGVPHTMTVGDGCVVFSDKSGFYGTHGRFMFVYLSHLWYLDLKESSDTFHRIAAKHIVKMHKLLEELVEVEGEGTSTKPAKLSFKEPA